MKFIIGKKIEMTQVFDEKNNIIPCTQVLVEKNVITQIKTEEKDGVNAVQISSGAKKNLNKPMLGHYKDLGNFAITRDFSVDNVADYKVGDEIKIDTFEVGDLVTVTGTSKGRGFAGMVKRYNFGGHHTGRGTKDQERTSGSIGATGIQRVMKGKRMAGRMGNDRVTVKNLKVVKIDKENGILFIKGAIPGARNSKVLVKTEK